MKCFIQGSFLTVPESPCLPRGCVCFSRSPFPWSWSLRCPLLLLCSSGRLWPLGQKGPLSPICLHPDACPSVWFWRALGLQNCPVVTWDHHTLSPGKFRFLSLFNNVQPNLLQNPMYFEFDQQILVQTQSCSWEDVGLFPRSSSSLSSLYFVVLYVQYLAEIHRTSVIMTSANTTAPGSLLKFQEELSSSPSILQDRLLLPVSIQGHQI